MKQIFFLIGMFLGTTIMAQYRIEFDIQSLPAYHRQGAAIYLAGSFNNWNPQDSAYMFRQDGKGNYSIAIKLPAGDYEYKLTGGSWDKVECAAEGVAIDNRLLKVEGPENVSLDIEGWSDHFPIVAKKETKGPHVTVIDTAFYIPKLKRRRRIWLYLPEGYAASKERYPVLYLQDGQNIFDEASSYAGEWAVDKWLDSTRMRKSIVVAIDNGGEHRMTEYNPYNNEKYGKGEGSVYVDFLVKTLKPFIDRKYRTLKSKPYTMIGGSSMGGLISFYALLKYPGVFGGAAIFSPSFPLAPSIYDDVRRYGAKVNSKIYFYCGKQEGIVMCQHMLKAFELMQKVSHARMESVIRSGGRHNEAAWRKEFPYFYKWVMK